MTFITTFNNLFLLLDEKNTAAERLCQRTSNHFYLNLHHEIFRYVFNGKGIINDSDITLFSKEDFSLFNLPENWDKIIYTDSF
jgi:hypothetical protein